MQLNRNIDEAEGDGTLPDSAGHTARACKAKARAAYGLASRAERALRVDPIVEILAMVAAALEVAVIRRLSNLFKRWT